MKASVIRCAACGAVMEFELGRERVFCSFCGAENQISPGDHKLAGSIDRIANAAERNAAELALVRLRRELRELQEELTLLVYTPPQLTLPETRGRKPSFGSMLLDMLGGYELWNAARRNERMRRELNEFAMSCYHMEKRSFDEASARVVADAPKIAALHARRNELTIEVNRNLVIVRSKR